MAAKIFMGRMLCKLRAYWAAGMLFAVVTRLVRDCALGRVIQYSRDVHD
jgi:hypothetical protein